MRRSFSTTRPRRTGASVPRRQTVPRRSALGSRPPGRDGGQQRLLPGAVGQQSIKQPTPALDDLARQPDHRGHEALELHPHHVVLLLGADLLGLGVAAGAAFLRQHQAPPRLEAPRQGGHDHVGPVADEIVHRKAHRIDPVLEWLDDMFLITPLVGASNDFGAAQVGARGMDLAVSGFCPYDARASSKDGVVLKEAEGDTSGRGEEGIAGFSTR